MAIADGNSLPVAIGIESASPNKIRLVDDTIDNRFTKAVPDKIVGDKAYDSAPQDEHVAKKYGTELIAPYRT